MSAGTSLAAVLARKACTCGINRKCADGHACRRRRSPRRYSLESLHAWHRSMGGVLMGTLAAAVLAH